VREQQRRIVAGHEARRADDRMALRLEELKEFLADFGGFHGVRVCFSVRWRRERVTLHATPGANWGLTIIRDRIARGYTGSHSARRPPTAARRKAVREKGVMEKLVGRHSLNRVATKPQNPVRHSPARIAKV